MKKICTGLIIFIAIHLAVGSYQEISIKARPLKGLDSMGVVIEKLDKEAIDIGLSKERLRTIVELRLRKEGIVVHGPLYIESLKCLYVYANVTRTAFCLRLSFYDSVILERDPSIIILTETWHDGGVGIHGNDAKTIEDSLSELMDSFLNDFFEANPKK
jgi:hypothetical protein